MGATSLNITRNALRTSVGTTTRATWPAGDRVRAAANSVVHDAACAMSPSSGADVGGFVSQLLDPTGFPDLKGAAVTNTAAVGGAGITLALKLLSGQTVQTSPDAKQPNTVLLDPVLVDNLTPDGQAKLKAWQSVPGMDPLWPLSLGIDGWKWDGARR